MTVNTDILLTNAVVLTMDEGMTIYEPGALAVRGDSILAVGPQDEITASYNAPETINCNGRVLMPGLINAHTHVPMTLLRGLADDLRLDVWLMGYIMPVERRYVSPEFVQLGTRLACAELIRTGVTCFADMYYFEGDVAQATAEAGLRAVCGHTVLKFPAPDARDYEESLAAARIFIQQWKGHPLIIPSIAPHAAFTSTIDLLRSSAALAVEFNVPLQIHISETTNEVDSIRDEHGMPVVPFLKKQDILDAKVLAAHCVHLDEGEINTLKHHNAGVAHNPSSNLKLASGIAPIARMIETGLNVGIGTDGPASNNDLDMFEEIRLAAFLAKSINNDPTKLPAATALNMATRMGAHALHIEHLTGSLEVGKRADLILVDVHRLHNAPRFRREPDGIYAQLVYAGHATDVVDVMVNGQWLMRDHCLLTLDESALMVEAQALASHIDTFLIEREQSLLSKLIAIGGATEEESFEVQVKVLLSDPEPVIQAIKSPDIEVLHHRHYHEYDTYFSFIDPEQGRLRYREDEYLDKDDQVSNVRYRLTLLGPAREHSFPSDVLLSRSRFIAAATHSLRFYREYFKPARETIIEKDRLRWRVLFKGTEFYINLDHIINPSLGYFLEVKSRTWSRRDAENKATIAQDLIQMLNPTPHVSASQDYIEIVESQ